MTTIHVKSEQTLPPAAVVILFATLIATLVMVARSDELAKPSVAMVNHDLRQCYESGQHLLPLGYNIAGVNDRTGSGTPNNEFPWRHTGGTDGLGIETKRSRTFAGGRVEVWIDPTYRKKFGWPHRHQWRKYKWRFPVGTRFEEVLSKGGKDFEMRFREKVAKGKWEHGFEKLGESPIGYTRPDNCNRCHEDIGKNADELIRQVKVKKTDEWYGEVRGSEEIFSWHPFDESFEKNKYKPVLRSNDRSFVFLGERSK